MDAGYREGCKRIKEQIDELLRRKESKDIFSFLQDHMETIKYDNDLMAVWYLGKISQKETDHGLESLFTKENDLKSLLERHRKLKFYLRRIEYDIPDDDGEFYHFLMERNISEYELSGMIESSVYDKEKVMAYLAG